MKRKFALIMTAVLAMSLFTGCGSEEDNSVGELNTEKYVTLGEYKGLSVTVAEPSVSDAEIEEHLALIFNSYTTAEDGITDREVAVGDTVNIDYEGKKDDVAFEGGTAADQELTIGSGRFIDGFEDGLVGVMPGETIDLNLSFPENYGNEELNGQAVVFTVTVNYIYPSIEDCTDEEVASWGNGNFSTVAEMEQFAEDYLNHTAQTNYNNAVESSVMQAFMENCVFEEIPESLIADYRSRLQSNMEMEASMYGLDAETFCTYYYGIEYNTFLDTYSEESAKQVLAFQAVADVEGLTLTDEELENILLEFATQNGYATVDEFIGTNTREEYKEYYMFEDVLAFLVENAVVTAE